MTVETYTFAPAGTQPKRTGADRDFRAVHLNRGEPALILTRTELFSWFRAQVDRVTTDRITVIVHDNGEDLPDAPTPAPRRSLMTIPSRRRETK